MIQELARTFAKLKKPGSLPCGCSSIELLDEDDITSWFVALSYPATDGDTSPLSVSLKLAFSMDAGCQRMPTVFVVQPRLVAPFIHHGAICSLDLMSQDGPCAPTVDTLQLLLLSLHQTLDVRAPNSSVSIDSSGGSLHYSSREHDIGRKHIEQVHPAFFRHTQSVLQASVPAPTADLAVPAAQARFHTSTNDDLYAALRHQSQTCETHIMLDADVETNLYEENREAFVVTGGSRVVVVSTAALPTDSNPTLIQRKLVIQWPLIIEPGGTLSVHRGVLLNAVDGIRCGGNLILNECEVGGSGVTLEGEASLMSNASTITSSRCASGPPRSVLNLLDNATASLDASVVRQFQLSPQVSPRPSVPNAAAGNVVSVSNTASLTTTNGTCIFPICEVAGMLPCTKSALYAEDRATIALSDTLVVAGVGEGVLLQSCTASIVRCVFTSWLAIQEEPCVHSALFHVRSTCRSAGLCAELGAKVSVSDSVAFGLYFGFSTIGGSISSFDRCGAYKVVNGFTVDASVSTMSRCHSSSQHVGVFALHSGKCTIVSSSSTSTAVRDEEDIVHVHSLESAWRNRDGNRKPTKETIMRALIGVLRNVQERTLALMSEVSSSFAESRPGCALNARNFADITSTKPNFNGLPMPSTFLGGLFSIETRNATVHASGILSVGAGDSAVYAYDGAQLTLCDTLVVNPPPELWTHASGKKRRQWSPWSTTTHVGGAASGKNDKDQSDDDDETEDDKRRHRERVGVKAFSANRVLLSAVSVVGCPFGFAVVGTPHGLPPDDLFLAACVPPLSGLPLDSALGAHGSGGLCCIMRDCFCSGCMNGFTIDGTAARLVNCGSEVNHVNVFALNGSRLHIASDMHPPLQYIDRGARAVAHIREQFRGGRFGIEVRGARVWCAGLLLSGFTECGCLCYEQGSLMKLVKCLAVTELPPGGRLYAAEISGMKAYDGGLIEAVECCVRGMSFGYSALHGGRMDAVQCMTRDVVNGFTIDNAHARIEDCDVAECRQVSVYALSSTVCAISNSRLSGGEFGLEVKCAKVVVSGNTKIFNFSKTGVLLLGSDDSAHTHSFLTQLEASNVDIDARSSNDHAAAARCCEAVHAKVVLRGCSLRGATGCALLVVEQSSLIASNLRFESPGKDLYVQDSNCSLTALSSTWQGTDHDLDVTYKNSNVRMDGSFQIGHGGGVQDGTFDDATPQTNGKRRSPAMFVVGALAAAAIAVVFKNNW